MSRNTLTLYFLAGFLSIAIFIIDLHTPLGVADGVSYISVVLITLWLKERYSTSIAAVTGVSLTFIGFLFSPPGEDIYIALTNRLLAITGILVAAFVILKYKKAEVIVLKQKDDLTRLANDLKLSNAELEQFSYVASHDLQEPLRKIQSFGERLMANGRESLSEQSKDYLSRMMNASSRMQNLINDLLSYSRLTTREEPFVSINMNDVLHEVLSDMEVSIEKSGAKMDIGNLPVINANKTQMRQLFQNLISNAIKFRKKDEPLVIKIYAAPSSVKGTFDFFVQDNGIGFDEQYSDKIFQFFQRLEGNKQEGSGIGLAICKKIALQHGGDISVKSTAGKGTTFIVQLPVIVK
jgi:light-regulated signal transduction histidine kinase (bacteriophytochrome)